MPPMPVWPVYSEELPGRFARDGYLRLPGLLTGQDLAELKAELRRLEGLGKRRDFAMACMDGSPRRMTTLGGHVIAAESELIPQLATDTALLGLLRHISRLEISLAPDPVERFVVNVLHQESDTHGAHVDDYQLALVLFTEAPASPDDGGLLEYVPHASGLDQLVTSAARRAHHAPGDAYLLRADTTAHRVTPLRRPGLRRTVLNIAYATACQEHTATAPSAALLYG